MKLGIDFGTSFSLGAIVHLDNKAILLPGGTYGIPSIFYYDRAEGVLIGQDAEDAGQGNQAKNLKRKIKMELNSTFEADGKKFSAKEIVGYILKYVKDISLRIANEKNINEPLEGVVISVPAAFTTNEKEFIRAAAEIPENRGGPGLKVLGFIKEPVAAALAYFSTPLTDNTKILVYDLGGGTLILKGDRLPKESEHGFSTIMDGQKALLFKVFESTLAKKDCELYEVGDYVMEVELPLPDNTPKGTVVKVTITLTANGLIEVVADDDKGNVIKGNKKLNF